MTNSSRLQSWISDKVFDKIFLKHLKYSSGLCLLDRARSLNSHIKKHLGDKSLKTLDVKQQQKKNPSLLLGWFGSLLPTNKLHLPEMCPDVYLKVYWTTILPATVSAVDLCSAVTVTFWWTSEWTRTFHPLLITHHAGLNVRTCQVFFLYCERLFLFC